ncbi:MAG: carboxypeptidase-like regulatory domain-containing protein, partial [Bacteroidales bacterium]|nr:carboxypeptidase-like regulatory domain-containing protein [Bacteroidales bacterium]
MTKKFLLTICIALLALSGQEVRAAEKATPKGAATEAPRPDAKSIVKGKVTDSAGEPLIGAGVMIKGRGNVGVTTDIDGNFSIEAAPADILQFSFIGFKTLEIAVGNSARIDAVLEEDANLLDD